MQFEDTRGAEARLSQLLDAVVTAQDQESALLASLRGIQDITGASGVNLTRMGGIRYFFSVGRALPWFADRALDEAWLSRFPAGLTRLPDLGVSEPGAACWYTVRLQDPSVLMCLWFEDENQKLQQEALQAVLNLVSAASQMYVTKRRHERADQLAYSVINSILDPLLVLTEDYQIVIMNDAAEALFGIKTEQAIGQSLSDVVQSDALMTLLEDSSAQQSGRPPEWVTEGDEAAHTFLPFLSTVHTPEGVSEGWVLALRDVTRFKRLNTNQREFMRVVSHDLRSPLTSMKGFADMIRMGMVGDLTEKQAYFVDKILSGISQMESIVENIQDAGRFDPETGFYEMERHHVDVGEIARRIVDTHIVPAEKQNLTIEINVVNDVPIINADENMLTRAMTNLVDNAIKYTPDGGKVEVNIHRKDGNLLVSVADDGYGISEEDQKRLFRRHVRLTRKEHKKVKGTGLGLFIVRSVAQAHGGDAIVHSVLGEGTTFSIVIPLSGSNLIGVGS